MSTIPTPINRLLKFTLLLLFAVPVLSARASIKDGIAWKNVSVEGRKTTVFSIFADSGGLMWIGTNNGLYTYDGTSARKVKGEVFSVGQVYGIVEHDGKLYAGTNNGLLYYDKTTGASARFDGNFPFEIRTMLLIDDTLWIGSIYGLYRYDLKSGKLNRIVEGLPHQSVYSILRDSRGVIYVGTYDGLAWLKSAGGETEATVVKIKASGSKGNLFVNSMVEDPSGEFIWMGTEEQLLRYYPLAERVEAEEKMQGHTVKSLTLKPDGKLIAGTDKGLFLQTGDSFTACRHDSRDIFSISDNEVWCVFADSSNHIWAGTEMGFSIAANSNSVRTLRLGSIADSGEGNQIYTVHRDRAGCLWLGGTNGLLLLDDAGGVQWFRASSAPFSISHNWIRAIEEGRDGKVWIATDGGVNEFDRKSNRFFNYRIADSSGQHKANWVYGIIDDADGLWIGSYLGGIHRVGKSRLNRNHPDVVADYAVNSGNGLNNDLVNEMRYDREGNIWALLFRDSMVVRIDPKGGPVCGYNILEIAGAWPTHITTDRNGRLWTAFNGGVSVTDKNGRLIRKVLFPFTETDEAVLAMGNVGKDVWIATVSNVWSIDGESFEPKILPLPQKYYTAVYEDPLTGNVILGAIDEFVIVDPVALARINSSEAIRMIATEENGSHFLFVNEATVLPAFEVAYDKSFSLTLSALDYAPDALHRYAYKLVQDESDTLRNWLTMPDGVNAVSLSNLAIGKHKLMVKVVGSLAKPVVVGIRVLPPWYLSGWAIALYSLALLAALGALFVYLRKKNAEKLREAERRRSLATAENRLAFLSNISHDLKTPLSMIIGPVSQMREEHKDSAIRHKLDVIYDNALKLNALIHRTIEINRLENNDDNLLIIFTIDAVEFCRSVFDSYRESHPGKKFVFLASSEHVFVDVDAVKFESVLNNLFSNACKYSETQATITCGVTQKESMLEIVVSDDGMGISQADQSLVFQRMYRSPRTSALREGTGIGLYLIKKYLEMHGGDIRLYSCENEGTTLVVTLPISRAENEPVAPPTAVAADSSVSKILIVEDNASIAAFIREILANHYNCLIADNGRSGLAVAASFQPDLIILDEIMPVMDGLEMCRRLKQHPRLSHIPIIMLTAKTDNVTETESVRLGVDIFMGKPFEAPLLLERVRHLLVAKAELREAVRIEAITTPKPIEAESGAEKQLAAITKIIEDNVSDPDLNVNYLSEKSGIGTKQLYRLIKKLVGVTPVDYIRQMRMQKAAMLLEQRKFTVSEVMYMVGFNTASYFSKCFQAQYGCKPSQYVGENTKE
ncbi:MAG: response regulator [Parabacteroides sp.]|nr:response regulator [Parabacteroides sp.]